jgi:hypothetical protein
MILFLEIFGGMCYLLVAMGLLLLSGANQVEFWPKHVGRKWSWAAGTLQALLGIAMLAAAATVVVKNS